MGFKLFCVLLVIGCAVAQDQDKLPAPCAVEDVACFNKANKEILEQTAGGIPKYGLKAFDPLVIPSFELEIEGVKAEFKDLKIVGFKNEEVTDMKLDRAAKTMVVSSKETLKFDGDFDLEFLKLSKKIPGKYDASAVVLLTATYNYELKTDDKGVQHFHIVSESIECDATEVNEVDDPKFQEAMNSDPELSKEKYTEEKRKEVAKTVVCKIVKKGLETLLYNMKKTADYFPVTAFFSNF